MRNSAVKTLKQTDAALICAAWDAEQIWRDPRRAIYRICPLGSNDQQIATSLGVAVVSELRMAVLIWRNDLEET